MNPPGRNYDDDAALEWFLDELALRIKIDAVIEGDARGADRLPGEWARRNGIENVKFCADWRNSAARQALFAMSAC